MKTITTIITMAFLAVLFDYGYTYSMTEAQYAVQGYIGTMIPVIAGLFLFVFGRISAQ